MGKGRKESDETKGNQSEQNGVRETKGLSHGVSNIDTTSYH